MDRKLDEIEEGEEETAPFLLISSQTRGNFMSQYYLYNVSDGGRCHNIVNIPMLDDCRVVGSTRDGWLVLVCINAEYCCLWNPEFMGEIPLPALEHDDSYRTCVLSKSPAEVGCCILLNSNDGSKQSYCKIGDDVFRTQTLERGGGTEIGQLSAMCSFSGKIYGFVECLGGSDTACGLVSIDFDGDGRLEMKQILEFGDTLDVWSRPWPNLSDGDYMVDGGDNELLLVRLMRPVRELVHCSDFRVFRIDMERMECAEVECIGDRTLFLSSQGNIAFCCASSLNKTNPNSIYYMRPCFGDPSRTLFIYNMDDGSTTSVLPSSAVQRYSSSFYWIHQQPAKQLLMLY